MAPENRRLVLRGDPSRKTWAAEKNWGAKFGTTTLRCADRNRGGAPTLVPCCEGIFVRSHWLLSSFPSTS